MDPVTVDEDHVWEYFGGDHATAELFLGVLGNGDAASGEKLAGIADRHFGGDVATARRFCALGKLTSPPCAAMRCDCTPLAWRLVLTLDNAAWCVLTAAEQTKVQIAAAEENRQREEAKLAEIASAASEALNAKHQARIAERAAMDLDSPSEPGSPSPRMRGAVSVRHLGEATPTDVTGSMAEASPGIMQTPVVDTKKIFNTKSVHDRQVDREKAVQRTMDLLRSLENARLDTDAGPIQLQGAVRPKSYTHELLKSAGLKFRRGKPVFEDFASSRRSASVLSYADERSKGSARRFREQGHSMAITNRRAGSATPSLGLAHRDLPGASHVSVAISESSSKRSRPRTLAPLRAGKSQTASYVDDMHISLPVLCQIKTSETAALVNVMKEPDEKEKRALQIDADLEDDVLDFDTVAQKRLELSKLAMAKKIVLAIDENTILLSTQVTSGATTHNLVAQDGEARDTMRRVEGILGDIYGIDIRDHGIPIRVTDAVSEIKSSNVAQKGRLNAHSLEFAPRAACVKKETLLPKIMGRHMHSSAYNDEKWHEKLKTIRELKERIQQNHLAISGLQGGPRSIAVSRQATAAGESSEVARLVEEKRDLQLRLKRVLKDMDEKRQEEQARRDANYLQEDGVLPDSYQDMSVDFSRESSLGTRTGGGAKIKLPPMAHDHFQRLKVDASAARAKSNVHRDVEELLVLRGMSTYQLAGEIAKVVGKSFLFLEHFDGLDSYTEGAFCELCSYLWAKEEKAMLMLSATKIHRKVAELEGELLYVEEELKVLQVHVDAAHKERQEADAAELHAKKALSAARDAVKYGWPGAKRKMEAAKKAEIDAARELEEAIEAEEKVIGKEYPDALEKQRHVKDELQKERIRLQDAEAAMSAYTMYMVAQENNPHPISGETFRRALLGFESTEGKMRLFLAHLKEKGEIIQPRPKTKEEIAEEEAARLRILQDEYAREAEEQREMLGSLFSRITDRLREAPPGAPGMPAVLSYEEQYAKVKSTPAKTFEEQVMDDLDDKMRKLGRGGLASLELAEYCAMTIRGEHDAGYCYVVGVAALAEAKRLRFEGDLESASNKLTFGGSALHNSESAGNSRAREYFGELEYLEKVVARELNQLQKAIVCHELAEKAFQDGRLSKFRNYWDQAKSLYESVGATGQQPKYLPALLRWDELVKVQEKDLFDMIDAISATEKALEVEDMLEASQQIRVATSLIEKCSKTGGEQPDKAKELLKKVMDKLAEQRKQQESLCKSAIVTDRFGSAENCILEIWKSCRLSAFALGEVAPDASEAHLLAAQKKQAEAQSSPVVGLSEELAGTREQHAAISMIKNLNLKTWPLEEAQLLDHKAKALQALESITNARKHLEAAEQAGSEAARAKVLALQPVELDLALRVHSNDSVRKLLEKKVQKSGQEDKEAKIDRNGCAYDSLPFICVAAAANNAKGLELLLVDGDVNLVDEHGNTAVHHAVQSRSWDALRALGKVRKANPNKVNVDHMTPMHMAVLGKNKPKTGPVMKGLVRTLTRAKAGNTLIKTINQAQVSDGFSTFTEAVDILLTQFWKINPNIVCGKYGTTALHLAAEVANYDAQSMLLNSQKVDPNVRDNRGRSPLIAAIWAKQDISIFLNNPKVDVNQAIPKNGWTPLHVCIVKDSIACMKQLLQCDRINVAAMDLVGFTPSHMALESNSHRVVNILMETRAIQESGGPQIMNWLSTARRLQERGDPSQHGLWAQATREILELLPKLLLDLHMWDQLHDTICNISFAAAVIKNLGIDTAIDLFGTTCEQVSSFPGVPQEFCSDFVQYRGLLEKFSDEIRTGELSFTNLAVDNNLWGTRYAQPSVVFIVEQVDAIRGDKASKMKKDSQVFFECLQHRQEMQVITDMSLQKILPSKRSFDRADNFIKQLYLPANLSMGDIDSCFLQAIHGAKADDSILTLAQISGLFSVTKTQSDTGALKVVMKNTIDHSKIRSSIIEALSKVVPVNEPHVMLRVARVFVHMGNIIAIVTVSKNPVTCTVSFGEGRLQKTLNAFIDSFRGRSNDTRLKPVINELKILSMTVIEPSVFVVMDLVPDLITVRQFKDKDEYSRQVLMDMRNSCNLQANLLRVCRVSESWNQVIVEIMHDDINPQNSFSKNKIMAERLMIMARTPSTVLHKGVVTKHIASMLTREGHVVPCFEGQWQEFRVHIIGSSLSMHNELKLLEDWILPAANHCATPSNCSLTWKSPHDRTAPQNFKAHSNQLQDLEHTDKFEIVIALVGDLFGSIVDIDGKKTSRLARELEHHLLEVPGASQVFVFQRDLEGLEETAYPPQYKAAISDIDKSDAQEMLKQLKRKLDRQSGQTVNQYKPPIAGFSLDLDQVFSEAKSILQKWDKSKEQLDSLRLVSSDPDDFSNEYAIKVMENRMNEMMESCARWIRILYAENTRGGVPSQTMEALQELEKHPMFDNQRLDLQTPDLSDVRLSLGLQLDVNIDMFHAGLAIVDSVKAQSTQPSAKPPFHSHLHQREVQATLRIEAAKHFCLEPGSSLHKTLEELEQVTCPPAMERTKSDQMSQLRAPRKPVVLLMGNDGAGKTSTLAAMAQKLSDKRYLQNLHGSMLATDESVEVPEVQIYFKMTGRHTFSAALHYLNVELAAQLHGKIGLQKKHSHRGNWEEERSMFKTSIQESSSSIIFLLDGFSTEHRQVIADLFVSLSAEHSIQCVMCAESGAKFAPDTVPDSALVEFELEGLSDKEQVMFLASIGDRFKIRDLTSSEQGNRSGETVCKNPLYLLVYGLACTITPPWVKGPLPLPDNLATLVSKVFIPFLSDWLNISTAVIEAVLDVAHINSHGVSLESLQLEVQNRLIPGLQEEASISNISALNTHLSPLWRAGRSVHGLISLEHGALATARSGYYSARSLQLCDDALQPAASKKSLKPGATGLDTENADPALLERLKVLRDRYVELFDLKITRPIFSALDSNESLGSLQNIRDEGAAASLHEAQRNVRGAKDWQWASAVMETPAQGIEAFEVAAFCESSTRISMDPGEALLFAFEKWNSGAEQLLNAFDVDDESSSGMELESSFDVLHNQLSKVTALAESLRDPDQVVASFGLELVAQIYGVEGTDISRTQSAAEMAGKLSQCLAQFQKTSKRILTQRELLEEKCASLSIKLVDHNKKRWDAQQFLVSNIHETLGQLRYRSLGDFRGNIELIHRRAVSQVSEAGVASPWIKLSLPVIREACERLNERLLEESARIIKMVAEKRKTEFMTLLEQLRTYVESSKVHHALDVFEAIRSCGHYPQDAIDRSVEVDEVTPELSDVWSLKNELDRHCEELITYGPTSVAFGPAFAKEDALVGIPTLFIIQSKNKRNENLLVGGESQGWEIKITDRLGPVEFELIDNTNGTYEVAFVPRYEEPCCVSIDFRAGSKSKGLPVKGSPFKLAFRRFSWWSQRTVLDLPKNLPGRILFAASSEFAFFLDNTRKETYKLNSEEENSGSSVWQCTKAQLAGEDVSKRNIKGLFALSSKHFLGFTDALSSASEDFSKSCVLFEMKDKGPTLFAQSLVSFEQDPPEELKALFSPPNPWAWSNLSCRNSNKVEAIPELLPEFTQECASLPTATINSCEELSNKLAYDATGRPVVEDGLIRMLPRPLKISKVATEQSSIPFSVDGEVSAKSTRQPDLSPPVVSPKRSIRKASVSEHPEATVPKVKFSKATIKGSSNRYEDFSLPVFVVSVQPGAEANSKASPVAMILTHFDQYSKSWRKRASSVFCEGRLVVFGGFGELSKVITCYHPKEGPALSNQPLNFNICQPAGKIPCRRCNFYLAYHDKRIILHGGVDEDQNVLNDLYIYDLEQHKWDRVMALASPNTSAMIYAAGVDGLLALSRCDARYQLRTLNLKNILDRNSIHMCGEFSGRIIAKIRHKCREIVSRMNRSAGADSWLLRLAVYKALNRGDIEAMCQNVVQMIHFLNMHKDEYGIDLTGLQEDMNETLQMKEEMATFATNLQVKLKKVPNAQASHGLIEKCYRLRAQYLSSSSATLRAPFAQIDTGYHAAAKALEYATTHLQELKNSFAELEKITALFGVAETMGAERTAIDKQLKTLEYFRHAWDLHSKLFDWADMALGHVNMHDTSFISNIKEELLEISSKCETFAASGLCHALQEFLEDASAAQQFVHSLKLVAGKAAESWHATKVLCSLSQRILHPPTLKTVLHEKVLREPKVCAFLPAVKQDFDSAMTNVTTDLMLQCSRGMQGGIDGLMTRSMYSITCFCEIHSVVKKLLPKRSASRARFDRTSSSDSCEHGRLRPSSLMLKDEPTAEVQVVVSAANMGHDSHPDLAFHAEVKDLLSKTRLGQDKQFKEILDRDPTLYSKAVNENGSNLFHIAATNGHKKIVKEIMRNGDKIDLYARDQKGRNALDLAIEFKYHEVADYLKLKLPRLLEPATSTTVDPKPAAENAELTTDSDTLSPLRPGQDPATKDVLSKAKLGKHAEFKELTGRDPTLYQRAVNEFGSNLLHIAATNGHKMIVQEIMDNEDKIDLYARDHKGRNALDLAKEFKYDELADFLEAKLPMLGQPAPVPATTKSMGLHGIRVDFTMHGVHSGTVRTPYLCSGSHANFVVYAPTKVKTNYSAGQHEQREEMSAWFIVGPETGPWKFAYGEGFTEVALQEDGLWQPAGSQSLTLVPYHVNLIAETANSRRNLEGDTKHYSRSEFMAEFSSYARRQADIAITASRQTQETLEKEQWLLSNQQVVRDAMNRPVVVDGLVRGVSLSSISTTYHRDPCGRIVVPDGIVRNASDRTVGGAGESMSDWRAILGKDAAATATADMAAAGIVSASAADEVADEKAAHIFPPTAENNLEELAYAGQQLLQNLAETSYHEVVDAIVQTDTPFLHALLSQMDLPQHAVDTANE